MHSMVAIPLYKLLVSCKWASNMMCSGQKSDVFQMVNIFSFFLCVVIWIASWEDILCHHITRYSMLKPKKPALLEGVDFVLPWQSLPLRNHGDMAGVYAQNGLQNVALVCFVMSLFLRFHGNSNQGNVLGMKSHGRALLLVWAIAPQFIAEARNDVLEYG